MHVKGISPAGIIVEHDQNPEFIVYAVSAAPLQSVSSYAQCTSGLLCYQPPRDIACEISLSPSPHPLPLCLCSVT